MHVVLVHPQIAANTGNIIRLCANTGATLHLVEPLGFSLASPLLKRAGLDYHEFADLRVHPSWNELAATIDGRVFALSSKGATRYDQIEFRADDWLVFGAERPGLPADLLETIPEANRLVIPMRPHNRSLNLANAVALMVYEGWRQQGFRGAAAPADPGQGAGLTAETPGSLPFDK